MYDNEELTTIAEDCESSIKMAMSELDGIEEYKEICNILEEALDELEETSQTYKDKYEEELELEKNYENSECERSKI